MSFRNAHMPSVQVFVPFSSKEALYGISCTVMGCVFFLLVAVAVDLIYHL